jgi:hypothetical protein
MRSLAVLFGLFLLASPVLPFLDGSNTLAEAGSYSSWNKVFHLHDGAVMSAGSYDWANSSGTYNPTWTDYDGDSLPGITIKKNVPPQRYHTWIMYPAADSDIVISGSLAACLWVKSQGNESGTIVSGLFYDITQAQFATPLLGTLIGQGSSGLTGPYYSEFQLVNLSTPSLSYTLPQGHYLALTVERGDSINDWLIVWFDRTDYDSYITMTTSQFVSVNEVHAEDASGVTRTVFSDLEEVVVSANVSDPFGSYDIQGANVTVSCQSNGTVMASLLPMTLARWDTSTIPRWKVFQAIMPTLWNGTCIANVTARDYSGYPAWLNTTFTILTVDHFGVSSPNRTVSGAPFALTIAALDQFNATITDWIGTVQLQAFKTDKVTLGNGNLSVENVQINTSDHGSVTIPNERYNFSEEQIFIKASSGPKFGWSVLVDVSSGAVVNVTIAPSGPLSINSSESKSFSVEGRDALGNINSTWTPFWNVSGGIGTIQPSGFGAVFLATNIGLGNLSCTNNLTGASSEVIMTVIAGGLVRINISSTQYPLRIHEGESVALTATGYDVFDNVVSIIGAHWDTTPPGTMNGTGSSAVFRAGLIPQIGVVNVRLGSVVGTLDVVVLNALNGPWLNPIPVQVQNEDKGRWELTLTGYWQDVNGTSGLYWWVEDVNTSLYFITHDPDHNSVMVFYTQPDQSGEDQFTLWVIDSEGFMTYQIMTVRILPANDPPSFVNNVPTELYVKFDVAYTFDYTYYVSDVDNAKSELALSSSAPTYSASAIWNISFDGLVASYLFKHKGDLSSYFEIVTLKVFDPGLLSDAKTIVVKVTDDSPPSLNMSLPNQTIREGTIDQFAFNLDQYFYDPDNEPLYFTSGFENIPPPFINKTTHDVYLSAPGEWSGITLGTFIATDGLGALKVNTISVTVLPVNDAPIVMPIDLVQVKHNLTYYLYLSPFISDPDNSLESLTIQVSDSNVMVGFSDTGAERFELYFPENLSSFVYTNPYRVTIWINVTDSGTPPLTTPGNFTVLVTDNAPPSVIAPKPDQIYVTFPENTEAVDVLMLSRIFSDSDDSTLNFTILSSGTSVHYTVASNGAVSLSADNNWSGTEILNITAKDAHGAWAFVQVSVIVTPVNQAPVAVLLRDKLIKAGGPRTLVYDLSAFVTFYDSDSSVLTIRVSPDANAVVVGDKIYVTLPSGVDSITVSLVANDGELDSNSVSVEIGIEKTIAQKIGYPYTLPLVLLAAGVVGYFLGGRIPRPYSLENLFLIHNDGRLIAHVTREENTILDKDVVSAMFTAVQEFVRDSFQKGEVGLKKLEIGDKSVLIEKGRYAYVALIYSGWPQKEVFDMLPMLLRDVEERFKDRIEHWNGTMKAVSGVDKMLQEYMANAYKPGAWHEEEEIAEEEWVDILSKEA